MRPMSDDLEPLLGQPPSSRQGAFRITRPPPLRIGEPRRSRKSKETMGEATSAPRAGLDRRAKQEGRQQEKLICEMRLAHGALGMTTLSRALGARTDPGCPRPGAQTNRLPAAAPSWRQCCELCGLWSRLVGFTASSSSCGRLARPARFAGQEPFTRRRHSDREKCRQSCVWHNWRGEKLNGRIAEQ